MSDDAKAKATAAERWVALGQRLVVLQRSFPALQVVMLIVVFTVGATTLPGLASWSSLRLILTLAAIGGLIAAGQTMLIIMGGFDLSVPGFILLGAVSVCSLANKYGIPFAGFLPLILIFAMVIGGIAGWLCHVLNIPPLILTLATGAVALGFAQQQTDGVFAGTAPDWLSTMSAPATKTFGVDVPPLVVIWVIVTVLLTIFVYRTVTGRRLLATGANMRAADYALVRTRRIWVGAFAFSAAMSVLVGVLLAGYTGSVNGSIGQPYLFTSVAAVIVGGTVFGGPGDYSRTVLGTLFLTVLVIVIVGHGGTYADREIAFGLGVLVLLAVYGRQKRIRDRL